MYKRSVGESIFIVCNYSFLALASVLCVLPILHLLAVSFSSKTPAMAGYVSLWPIDFTLRAYEFILKREQFFKALLVTLQRLVLGVTVNMFLVVLLAYPLSQEQRAFRFRTAYVWLFVLTILFNGGLIPLYMTVRATKLLDNIWALILPSAVPVFLIVLMLNFFRGIPRALQESAFIDGAGHWRVLWLIYVPMSTPAMATIGLFTAVFHWNSWFDGLIFMNRPENYPLQTYLHSVVIQSSAAIASFMNPSNWKLLAEISDKTVKAAQIIVAALPIILVYPFVQRYFMKGIVLGSVKG